MKKKSTSKATCIELLPAGKTGNIPIAITFIQKPFTHVILIILLGLLVYSNTFQTPFVFDDEIGVSKNITIRDLGYITEAYGSGLISLTRPIGQMTFTLNYVLNGLDVAGYHILNLLIHLGCGLLVYRLLILILKTGELARYFQKPDSEVFRIPGLISLLAALLFVSHPIQTQAVTYIVQRFTSLATFFYLMSFVLYLESRFSASTKGRYAFYGLSLITAVLAMKTKEISFTLPLLIILVEFMFFRGEIRKRIIYLIPLTLTMIIIPLSLIAGMQGSSQTGIGRALDEMAKGASLSSISRSDYLFTQFRVIVTYIRLLFLPVQQNLDYDYPIYETFFTFPVFSSFLFLLSIFVWGVYLLYRSYSRDEERRGMLRLMSFGIFWFFITISMESSIIPIADVINEHRLYLPSVGFFIFIMSGIIWVAGRQQNRLINDKTILSVLVVVVIVLSGIAYARNVVWQDEVKLWEDVVKKSPAKPRAQYNLHESSGRYYLNQGRYMDALSEFQVVLKLKADFADPHKNLGYTYLKLRQFNKALEEYQTALKYEPNSYEIHFNLGNIYFSMARAKEAVQEYQLAVKLNPHDTEARRKLEALQSGYGE